MKTNKIILVTIFLVISFSTLGFAAVTSINSAVSTQTITNQIKVVDTQAGLVSKMHVTVSADFTNKKVNIIVKDSKTYNAANASSAGFTYPDMAITIQRKAQGESNFSNIGTAQYKNQKYKPWGSTITTTEATASFTDTNVKSGLEYSYRIMHSYESKTYYTSPQTVTFPIRDFSTMKLKSVKRVDLYFEDIWTPEAGDVYKYELLRQFAGSEYKVVAEINPENKYVSDMIVDPIKGGIYYYAVKATCTDSDNSLKIGKSVTSSSLKVIAD